MNGLSPAVDLTFKLSSRIFDLKSIVNQFELEPGMRVADLGSGSGFFTVEMAKVLGEGGRVAAVDILDTALEVVKSRAAESGIRNVELVRADIEVSGGTFLADDSEDFVLLANVLFQNDQKTEILNEAARILRPAGRLAIIDWEKSSGGLGPPDEYRTPRESILALASGESLIYEKDLIVDAYHFGMVFRK